MAEKIDLHNIKFAKQLGGAEDLMFGFSSVTQIRNGQTVVLTQINADVVPYDTTQSVKEIIDKILAKYPL